ncbi:MAG: GGDEF domain-containing protein [Methylibium sp.]|nr:GGDEF domain-containing protein [Methylibium sp.]MBA3590752.1 GGDEF domain-containing protein [Methylibium sp.]
MYMLDLDKFKPVNDSLGHAAGDELLAEVARRLQSLVRVRDVVARLCGDELAIIQFHVADVEDADMIAGRILQEIRRPFRIRGQDVEIGVKSAFPIEINELRASGRPKLLTALGPKTPPPCRQTVSLLKARSSRRRPLGEPASTKLLTGLRLPQSTPLSRASRLRS